MGKEYVVATTFYFFTSVFLCLAFNQLKYKFLGTAAWLWCINQMFCTDWFKVRSLLELSWPTYLLYQFQTGLGFVRHERYGLCPTPAAVHIIYHIACSTSPSFILFDARQI